MLWRRRRQSGGGMKGRDRELGKYIEECAKYLIERSTQAEQFYSFEDAEAVELRIDRIDRELRKSQSEVNTLLKRDVEGRLHTAGFGLTHAVYKARWGIAEARAACAMARQELHAERSHNRLESEPRRYQLSAVRLAWAFCSPLVPRETRSVAGRIMQAADIQEPSKSTMSNLLKQVRS